MDKLSVKTGSDMTDCSHFETEGVNPRHAGTSSGLFCSVALEEGTTRTTSFLSEPLRVTGDCMETCQQFARPSRFYVEWVSRFPTRGIDWDNLSVSLVYT